MHVDVCIHSNMQIKTDRHTHSMTHVAFQRGNSFRKATLVAYFAQRAWIYQHANARTHSISGRYRFQDFDAGCLLCRWLMSLSEGFLSFCLLGRNFFMGRGLLLESCGGGGGEGEGGKVEKVLHCHTRPHHCHHHHNTQMKNLSKQV